MVNHPFGQYFLLRLKDMSVRVTDDEFEALVQKAIDGIPASFAPYMSNIIIEVADYPDKQTCESLNLSSRHTLLGLYHGIALTNRSVHHSGVMPDRITLYKRNIEDITRSRNQLVDQIRKTVLHEIGHHFGLDEDDLSEAGYG